MDTALNGALTISRFYYLKNYVKFCSNEIVGVKMVESLIP